MRGIDGKTKITGLIGDPVEHTSSPRMHNRAFDLLGLNYVYIPLPVKASQLQDALNGVRALQFAGVNVTIPHKEAVIPFLDEVTREAALIGAVNTIKNLDGRLIGYNTDGAGFVADVEDQFGFGFAGRNMLILGAGGAARAIAVNSLLKGIKSLMLVDPDAAKAGHLAKYLRKHFIAEIKYADPESKEMYSFIKGVHLLVNASPVGMHPNIDAVPVKNLDVLAEDVYIYDIIYNPLRTKLIELCESRGNKCSTGLGMLAGQGAAAFKIFTGTPIETGKMIEFLRDV